LRGAKTMITKIQSKLSAMRNKVFRVNEIFHSIEEIKEKIKSIERGFADLKENNSVEYPRKDDNYYDAQYELIINACSRPKNWFSHMTIYDVGMNKGEDAEYYLKKGFKL
jgi:hypothetical protein